MRVMVIVPGGEEMERGQLPPPELFEAMDRYNQDLVKAGVMLVAEGLTPTSKGKKVRFEGSKRSVIDGPFTETKELIGGFWLLQVRDIDEAVEWVKRAPFDGGVEIVIRPVADLDDYGDAVPESVRESEKRMRAQFER
jgi:hypothetical protein